MNEARALLEHYQRNPADFMRKVLRCHLWSKQVEVAESVRDNKRTSVVSAHGIGKTYVAARIVLWFLSCFPRSRVLTTAPTQAQVHNILWREIAVAHREARGFIGGELYGSRLEIERDWFAVGLATNEAERFLGHHAEHLLAVCDEASGIDEPIYEALAGSLTSEGSRLLLIGNPTQPAGEFFASFHSARNFYSTIRVSAYDSPNLTGEKVPDAVARKLVSKKWVEDMTKKWGEGSPLWESRINAQFPSSTDDTIIELGALEVAMARSLEPGLPIVIGCDVARYGSDSTVICVRRGNVVRIAKTYSGRNLMQTAGEITRLARQLQRETDRKPSVVIDDTGVGGGLTDRLQELGEFPVARFNASAKADSAEYVRKRDEAWFLLADRLPALDLPRDDELAADLLAPRYSLDSQGRRVVEPKADTKRRLRRSPDRADALILTVAARPVGAANARTASPFEQPKPKTPPPGTVRNGRGTAPEEIVNNPALRKHYFRMLTEWRNRPDHPDPDAFVEAWRESARAEGLL